MITRRPSNERGHFDHGWLDTYHTFSFGEYRDAAYMGFRSLRVMNEDVVAPGRGFPPHGHSDMEIITYVLAGALEHKDNLGSGEVVRPGDVQRMTAGRGVEHSEFNHSKTEPVHLLQIWIRPERRGLDPGYEQKSFNSALDSGALVLLASNEPRDGALKINQNAELYGARPRAGAALRHQLVPGRHAWLQLARGEVTLNNNTPLTPGDGAAITDETTIEMKATTDAEFLLFDLG